MRLRVTHKQHTHAGKTYRVGEEFEGSERLLAAFGDRLEVVNPPELPRRKRKAKSGKVTHANTADSK